MLCMLYTLPNALHVDSKELVRSFVREGGRELADAYHTYKEAGYIAQQEVY